MKDARYYHKVDLRHSLQKGAMIYFMTEIETPLVTATLFININLIHLISFFPNMEISIIAVSSNEHQRLTQITFFQLFFNTWLRFRLRNIQNCVILSKYLQILALTYLVEAILISLESSYQFEQNCMFRELVCLTHSFL